MDGIDSELNEKEGRAARKSKLLSLYVLYTSRLIPRLLSAWGFVGGVLVLAAAMLYAFNVISALDAVSALLSLPIAVLEMVLAVWLIVRGFNPSAIASGSAKVSEGPD